MLKKAKRKFRMLKNAIEELPEFKGNVKADEKLLTTKAAVVTYGKGVFEIHVRLDANPVIVAKLLNHIAKAFPTEIGEPFYPSLDNQFHIGEAAEKAFQIDCEREIKKSVEGALIQREIERLKLEDFFSNIEN